MVNFRKFKRIFLIFVFFVFSFPPFSVRGAEGGNFIQEVRIQGATRVVESTIRSHLQSKQGLIINQDQIDADIRSLYQLGFFQDVQVDEERGAHGWILTFIVTEKPIINKISFEGNRKIKDAALREATTVPLYQSLNEKKLADSIHAIRELYAKKNFYLVGIDYHLKTTPAGENELVFEIHEHDPALIRQVNFVGNTVFTDKELRAVVQTRKKAAFSFLTGSGKYKEELLKQDILRLTFHYLKNGYLKVQIDEPQVSLSKDKRYFFVSFHVQEGNRYHIGKVDVSGDILTTRDEMVANFLTKSGQIYNREFIEKDMQALNKIYGDQGYAFVHIQPLTTTDEVNKTADITYNIEKGNRIYVERIDISGNTITRDKVIRRELQIKEGDIYNETKLQQSRERLMALGFFKEVNFATPRGSKDDTLRLNVTVDEKPTGSFSVGAGFSTTENFVVSGSISKQNFFGRGWNGEISGELSSRRRQFLFSMSDPYFLDTEWIVAMSAFKTIFRYDSFSRDSYGGSFSIGHRFFDYASMSLGYEAEEVSAIDIATNVPPRFQNNASGLTSLVSLTLNRDTRDNRVYANRGMFGSIKAEVSDKELGAQNEFLRLTGRAQFYKPLFKDLLFKTYARAAYIKSLNTLVVPLVERYFLGGPNSLRGFYPQSIGPAETVAGLPFVYGGDKMAIINGELEYVVYEPAGIRAVTFFDAGNAYSEDQSMPLDKLRMDYGFGIRWISPMGPLRFEWGFPINRKAGEQKSVFNFAIGSFF
ncbi:MAG: outer membrane protein assembly factor BamA [Deltaproteobacteria bacterium RIFCSPLOWO2_02_FULL_46_8]|nr:MAG: outer membrane protein assembly factor BamA [Deltaproteobacteria bacterium RIFCSPLOWO2_02_FULL_46_8]